MVVLGGGVVSYERDTPVTAGGCDVGVSIARPWWLRSLQLRDEYGSGGYVAVTVVADT